MQAYDAAVAPGTKLNRDRQARAYLEFAVAYKVDYLRPSVVHATMFAQYLANSLTAPGSIKNYISGAKSWINFHMGSTEAFNSAPVLELLKKLSSHSTHVPTPALPITDVELGIIAAYLDLNPWYPKSIKPCILLSFACMFRASNVLSPSMSVWGGAHTLNASDIVLNPSGLLVAIRSSKTTGTARTQVLNLLPYDVVSVCPVRAWAQYVSDVSPPMYGPAFILDNGRPLTAAPVVSAIRKALSAAGYTNSNRYSMHSFRRGAVHVASRLGVNQSDIMSHGIWRSRAGLNHYFPNVSPAVSRAFAHGLAQ